MLTAAHNVVDGTLSVRPVDGREYPAVARLASRQHNLALLEVGDLAPLPWLRFAGVDRESKELVQGCWAVDFPRFRERSGDGRALRDTIQVHGMIAPGSGRRSGLLTLEVTAAPRPLPPTAAQGPLVESAWQGWIAP